MRISFAMAAMAATGVYAEAQCFLLFDRGTDYPVAGTPAGLVTADFNGDSLPDLAMIDTSANSVVVMLATRNGGFALPLTVHVVSYPLSLATGDLNNDGVPDLVVSSGTGAIETLLGEGDGTFVPVGSPAGPGWLPSSVIICDYDQDGLADLAIAAGNTRYEHAIILARGNGDGTFQPPQYFQVDLFPVSIATADFNGDGRPDFVTANQESVTNTVSVLLSSASGFSPITTYEAGGVYVTRPAAVAVGDFNGDGRPDVEVALRQRPGLARGLCGPDGVFSRFSTFELGNAPAQPSAVIAADFDDDGLAEVVVNGAYVGGGIPGLAMFAGQGSGPSFPRDATSMLSVDIDGDGRTDLVTSQAGGITVYRNERWLVWSPSLATSTCPTGTAVLSMYVCMSSPTIRWQRELAPHSGTFIDLFDGDSSEWDGGEGAAIVSGTATNSLRIAANSAIGGLLDDRHAIRYRCVVSSSQYPPTASEPVGLTICRSDFTCDGFLDFFDYDDYVNCFETGTCPPGKTADFNGDGFADFFDYDDFVAAFEAGC